MNKFLKNLTYGMVVMGACSMMLGTANAVQKKHRNDSKNHSNQKKEALNNEQKASKLPQNKRSSQSQAHGLSSNPFLLLEQLNQLAWSQFFNNDQGGYVTRRIYITNNNGVQEVHESYQEGEGQSDVEYEGGEKEKEKGTEKKITFKDIAGIDTIVYEMQEIVEYVKNPQKYKALGARVPKGILMEGPPGVGKSLVARALANECGCAFMYASGASFVEMYVGVGPKRVRELFAQARQNKPAIIFIDEIDALGSKRSDDAGGGKEYNNTVNQLLEEMQGFEDEEGIIIIAATNRADILDPALKRPGRFTRILKFALPDKNARESILKHYLDKLPALDKTTPVSLEELGQKTEGFNSAELADIVNTAALFACRENADSVTKDHLDKALQEAIRMKPIRSGVSDDYHRRGYTPNEIQSWKRAAV